MADKPRNSRRSAEGPESTHGRAPRAGVPGGRPPAQGRTAGKPATGPARPRKATGGYDRRIVEKLEAEGLLSAEGRRFFAGQLGDQTRKPAGAARGEGPGRGVGAAPRPGAARGEGAPRVARPERAERPERPGRPVRDAAPFLRGPKPAAAGKPGRFQKPNDAEIHVAERLHKVMAQAGVASRRHSEELIQAGRVTVGGKVVTELGTKVIPGRDIIEVDGRPLGKAEEVIYILLNKPKGYVTTLFDPQGRPKVTDLLGAEISQRVYPVGRLDYDTEGLLLLTNDGQLANALMHPSREVKKTYIAKVRGVPGPAKLRELESGVELDDGMTAPAEVKLISATGPNAATLSVRIHEGRNRQVRRMFEAVGHEVIHLKRTTLGPLHLKDLPVGEFRELSEREVSDLKAAVGLRQKTDRTAARAARVAAIVEQRKARRGAPRAAEGEGEPVGAVSGPGRGPRAQSRSPKRSFTKNRGPR
ncbi:MAG TPA: pseudouridine synthase [Symbiobacteriaceae bacterium]|nr:pseudouridine synthase [Symbiobacteriaceae bacterium]